MKRQNFLAIASCLLALCITESCKSKFDEKKYLTQILNNIEQVKSASYFYISQSSLPYDTVPKYKYEYCVKEFANPADTAVGVSYGYFYPKDTTKMERSYDGNASIRISDEDKIISIDSFKVYRFPFRLVRSFFNSAKNIIKYALTTNDSILTEFHDFGDSLLFRLTIYSDKQVVLVNVRPQYYGKNGFQSYLPGDETSMYDIWINNSTGLPYKLRVIDSNGSPTNWDEYRDLQINKMDIKDFIPSRYMPADYDIYVVGQQEKIAPPEENLTGKKAPDWTLSDYNNESFSLKDFKSKVLMVQFSGIGCPPCHASLPFLKQLVVDYENKSFELVRIECWSNNADAIKSYRLNNNITYKFLLTSDEIYENYNVTGVPIFFILDNNRIIQKVVRGYAPEVEKEIKEAIEKAL